MGLSLTSWAKLTALPASLQQVKNLFPRAFCPFPSKCSIFHLGSQKVHGWDVELSLAGSMLCLLWDASSCPFCLLSCFTRQNFFFSQKSFLWRETIGTHFRPSTELKKQVDGCLPKIKCAVCSKTFCFNFTLFYEKATKRVQRVY